MADATFGMKLMLEESQAKRRTTKRVLTSEDIYYMQIIEKMANEWLTFFRDQEIREKQVKETKKSMAVVSNQEIREKQVKETKKSTAVVSKSKRPWSMVTRENDHKKKKVQPKAVRTPLVINNTTKRMKEFIMNEMKCSNVNLVIQKTVFKSDTEKGLNRLNMPLNQLENDDFLTVDEKRIVNKRIAKENEIEVRLLGPTLEMYKDPMKLKMWRMASTVNYVLTTNWHRFWFENKVYLQRDSKIQVWSFRKDQQLCFAIVCVEEPDGEGEHFEDISDE